MKKLGLALLAAVAFAACRHPQTRPDYGAVRRRAAQSQQDLGSQQAPAPR